MNVKKWMYTLSRDVIALLLGIALTFAFAPHRLFLIAVIAPALLLALWLPMTPKAAFRNGFIFGVGLFGAGVYWVYISIHEFGEVPAPFALLITAGMIAILASYPALTGYCLNRFFPNRTNTKLLLAFPALWVLFEWMRSLLLSGFAWLLIGYSQTNSSLRGYASLLSVYGVSLAVVLSSALLVNTVIHLKEKNYWIVFSQILWLCTLWMAGAILANTPWTQRSATPSSLALVQGAIPQQLKWTSDNLKLSLDRYEALTASLWGKYQIIVWPETAVPMTLQEAAPFIDQMDIKAKASHTALILGIPIYVPDRNGYRNAIVTLGEYKNIYSKRHLVPFGEYVPFSRWLFPMLNFMNIPTSDVIAGDANQSPLKIGPLKIASSICYEITFPELIHTFDPTIGFLLTVSNDAWFGKSSAQAQHLQMAEMRALELQRPVVMVSNDGITAIIGPNGAVLSAAPSYQQSILTGQVYAMQGLTPWMKYGIDPLLFILLVALSVATFQNIQFVREQKLINANVTADK